MTDLQHTGRFRKPRRTPPPPRPPTPIATGEDATLGALADLLDQSEAPFLDAASALRGALGEVQHSISAAVDQIRNADDIVAAGSAIATPSIPPPSPGLPAAMIGGMHVGLPHTHTHPPSMIPPAPPVPLPSIGTVLLSGAVNVLINGAPAARAGDIGIAITCGSLAPPFEIILGSSSVFIGGQRAARVGDMARHCNPMSVGVVGQAMGIASGEQGASAGQAAADAAALALQLMIGTDPSGPPGTGAVAVGAANVLIGGFPCPNTPMVAKGLLRAAKGLRRSSEPAVAPDMMVGAASCAGG